MRGAALLLLMAGAAFPLVVGYHLDPVKASWSGWTHRDDTVSQILTINFDELDSASGAYCELFAGSKSGGGAYHVSVLMYPGGTEIATGNAGGDVDHDWVKLNLGVLHPESIVKGKQLEFRFSRSGGGGGDSIQYYFIDASLNTTSPTAYPYGFLRVGGQNDPTKDLCMRLYARANPVTREWWRTPDTSLFTSEVIFACKTL
jgi:hypothetical protein